jgi:hypothetical protein
MDALHFMEALRIEQLPGSKDVYLMRPDGSDIIEAEREIEEKKGVWIHDPNIDLRTLYGKMRSCPKSN